MTADGTTRDAEEALRVDSWTYPLASTPGHCKIVSAFTCQAEDHCHDVVAGDTRRRLKHEAAEKLAALLTGGRASADLVRTLERHPEMELRESYTAIVPNLPLTRGERPTPLGRHRITAGVWIKRWAVSPRTELTERVAENERKVRSQVRALAPDTEHGI